MMNTLPSLDHRPATNSVSSGNSRTNVAVVAVAHRRLDAERARKLITDVARAFELGARVVILDLAAVTFIDSLGVASLCAAAKRAPAGGDVVLAALGDYAQTVARITHLDEVFAIFTSVAAARAQLEA
jgi:anti-sigma B factor antagonist